MNQRELAKKLNVSQTTLSLVLNDPETPKVARSTRTKILDAFQSVQYRRKQKISAVRKICFVSNSSSGYQKQQFLDGVFQYAEEMDIAVELKSIEGLLLHKSKRYDGTGVILHGHYSVEEISKLQELMPVCHLNPPPSPYLCDSVSGDSKESVRKSILYFQERGIADFALWGFPDFQTNESDIYFRNKIEAFRALYFDMTGKDTEKHLILVSSTGSDYEELVRLTLQSLSGRPDCSAFIATSYIHARILYDAAIRAKRNCRIISCGYSEYVEPGMPLFDYITCDLVKMGKTAAVELLKRAECADAPVCSLFCCPELFLRSRQ